MKAPGISLAELEAMDRTALVALWPEVFPRPAPKGLSQGFLRRFIGFELQACRNGGLSARARKQLAQEETGVQRQIRPALKPGGRLLREWNGVTHVIDVVEGGFLWQGKRHRSLSAIARAITGAHWSGPRFFGLQGKAGR
jgi:hypothetical protein